MNPSWLPNLFPQYDNVQADWRARILAAVLLNSIPLTIALGIAVYLLEPGFSPDLVTIFLILVFEGSVWMLWRRRGLEIAAHVLVFGAWAIISGVVLFSGGISSASTVSQLLVVIISSLLTTSTVTLSLMIATGGFNATMLLLDLSVGLPGSALSESLEVRFAVHLVVLLLSTAILLYSNLTSRNLVQSLANSDRKFRALFEKSSDVVFMLGLDYSVIESNANASKILGYRSEELIGMPFKDLIPPEDRPGIQERFELARMGEVLDYTQSRFMAKSGDQIVMEVNLALVRGDNGKALQYQSTARDITAKVTQDRQLQTALATMALRANTDYLTGILNRDAVLQHADAEWARHQREGRPLSILLIDMDRLKFINDTYGHGVGDQALLRLVDSLEKNKRPYDWLGRYGGDEFMVVLPGTTLTIAKEIAMRMGLAVREKTISTGEVDLQISCSIGVASTSTIGTPHANIMELIKSADAALYANKAVSGS